MIIQAIGDKIHANSLTLVLEKIEKGFLDRLSLESQLHRLATQSHSKLVLGYVADVTAIIGVEWQTAEVNVVNHWFDTGEYVISRFRGIVSQKETRDF